MPFMVMDHEVDPKEKLKRVSIPKGIDPNSVDEKLALRILELPRLLGRRSRPHPTRQSSSRLPQADLNRDAKALVCRANKLTSRPTAMKVTP